MSESDNAERKRSGARDKRNSVRFERPALMAGIQVLRDWWNHSRAGRVVLSGVMSIALAAIVLTSTLSYNGFCFSQGRFLSDQEYVNIAISRIMSLPCYQLMSPTFKCVPPIKYMDVADFRARNPDCCKFVRHNTDYAGSSVVTFSQQLFGYAAHSVLVNFKISYVDADGHTQNTIGPGLIVVGNCGSILK
jgi:hypothetical protein